MEIKSELTVEDAKYIRLMLEEDRKKINDTLNHLFIVS